MGYATESKQHFTMAYNLFLSLGAKEDAQAVANDLASLEAQNS
jgi:hypothetical protein